MSARPTKRRRLDANPFVDLEAAVDEREELDEDEDESDRAFIDDEPEDDAHFAGDIHQSRQRLVDILREDNCLDNDAAVQEEEHSSLFHEWLGLKLEDDDNMDNLLDDEVGDDEEDVAVAVSRPLWAEIAHNNSAVSGALSTWQDDDPERQISAEDSLYEVSCQPGMEETIVFRILSWAMQVDSSGPTKHHMFERSAAPNLSIPPQDAGSSGPRQKRVVLARSAIANPFLRGRVYIESAKIGYVQRLARRVRGLNPASVRLVPREFLLRPLLMMRHSFPDRTFVRLLDPPCPSMTCLTINDYLLMVPTSIICAHESAISAGKLNSDNDATTDPPLDSRNVEFMLKRDTCRATDIRIDQYGFRYFPLKKLSASSLQVYGPSLSEVELLFKFGRLKNRHYKSYMSRIMTYGFSAGDRVIFQASSYDQLIGTVLASGDNDSCSIYVPSQGNVIQVGRQQLRRHFCIGDRVSATTDDVTQKLGSRIGWVVAASEGYKAAWSNSEDTDPVTGQPRIQVGYRVDVRVFSPESGNEVVGAHYEFRFEDSSAASLHTQAPPSSLSKMTIGTTYTLTIPLGGIRSQSFFGIVTAIEGVRVQRNGTERSPELSATAVFSIWDKSTDAPFGFPADWIEDALDFMDFSICLGDLVTLKDRNGRCGTARITCLGKREVSLANFTSAIQVSDLTSVRRQGPYDDHIGKTVRVVKGPYKGCHGVVKTVNAVGACTVELNIIPIRIITVSITYLLAVDESAMYLSLLPILAPPARVRTPPAPEASSSDIPPAFQPSGSDVPINPPRSPDLDCTWLARSFVHQMSIKLEPVNHSMKRPYHFSNTFYDNSGEFPRLMVRVFDRKKERTFAADDLKWLPASAINQTVVRITGEDNGTLYLTVVVDRDLCQVRQVPSKRRAPFFIYSRFELAQVNAKRT